MTGGRAHFALHLHLHLSPVYLFICSVRLAIVVPLKLLMDTVLLHQGAIDAVHQAAQHFSASFGAISKFNLNVHSESPSPSLPLPISHFLIHPFLFPFTHLNVSICHSLCVGKCHHVLWAILSLSPSLALYSKHPLSHLFSATLLCVCVILERQSLWLLVVNYN